MSQTRQEEKQILFKQGLPGFEDYKNFVISKPFEEYPFYYLNSTDSEEVSFLTINPFEITTAYDIELPETVQEVLEIKDPSEVAVFNIVNTSKGLPEATVNLQAPVIINATKSIGMQVVLNNPSLNIREPLKKMLERTGGK